MRHQLSKAAVFATPNRFEHGNAMAHVYVDEMKPDSYTPQGSGQFFLYQSCFARLRNGQVQGYVLQRVIEVITELTKLLRTYPLQDFMPSGLVSLQVFEQNRIEL
jgi:hypothetical protein